RMQSPITALLRLIAGSVAGTPDPYVFGNAPPMPHGDPSTNPRVIVALSTCMPAQYQPTLSATGADQLARCASAPGTYTGTRLKLAAPGAIGSSPRRPKPKSAGGATPPPPAPICVHVPGDPAAVHTHTLPSWATTKSPAWNVPVVGAPDAVAPT